MCEILLIIPARGNSKGIPRKNIRDLGGNPLVYYAIHTGLNSRFDIDVYVSSDDSEILHISKTLGAKTHKRSEKLSGCEVTLDPVVYDAYLDIGSRTEKKIRSGNYFAANLSNFKVQYFRLSYSKDARQRY